MAIWLLALFICFFSVTDSVNSASCLACSYIFAGEDGSYGRDCVSNATYFTNTALIPCNFTTHSCVIVANYDEGYARLISLSRNCYATPSAAKDVCEGGIRPRCQSFCWADRCNAGDGDLHAKWTVDGGNGMASLGLNMPLMLFTGGVILLELFA